MIARAQIAMIHRRSFALHLIARTGRVDYLRRETPFVVKRNMNPTTSGQPAASFQLQRVSCGRPETSRVETAPNWPIVKEAVTNVRAQKLSAVVTPRSLGFSRFPLRLRNKDEVDTKSRAASRREKNGRQRKGTAAKKTPLPRRRA